MNTNAVHDIKNFWAAGINYKKTDAALRGSFAINAEQYDQLLAAAPSYGLSEFFILSTCNRTEIYGVAPSPERLGSLLCSVTAGSQNTFNKISYTRNGRSAIEHLFSVGAGLDSQILGDYEILGQIRNAVRTAKASGCIGAFMERLVNAVLQASKAIKTHTALSGGTVSVSFAAVQYIREFFEGPASTPRMKCPFAQHLLTEAVVEHYIDSSQNIEDKRIVLLGLGEIGRSTCRNLVDYLNTRNITLINRTAQTAIALAEELGLRSAPMSELDAELAAADIVMVATGAHEPVVLAHHLAGDARKLVIDFSIPCNVAPEAQVLPNVKFVDVDILSRIKDETLQQRRSEVPKAVAIINDIVSEFIEWYDMRKHVPVLKEVKSKLKEMVLMPVAAGDSEPFTPADEERIQKVINSLAINIRKNNTIGCHYIQAINEYIA